MTAPERNTCPNCRSGAMAPFHEVDGVPANSCILVDSPEAAGNYPRGDVRLGFCPECGFISNLSFEPALAEYSQRYEETQGFSATFRTFHHDLAQRLVERYDLRNRTIIEVGCGKGEFLLLLCQLGDNHGVGFDPGVHRERIAPQVNERVLFIPDFYSERYSEYKGDFLVCKMTLEHIHATGDFISMIRRNIGDQAGVNLFFQVPDAERIFRDCAFEDIYYEHCSYFSTGSLRRLFQENGFEVTDISSEYGGQYLTIEACSTAVDIEWRRETARAEVENLAQLVSTFACGFSAKRSSWLGRLTRYASSGLKVAIWGAGSKAVAFISTLAQAGEIGCAVDINPYRQGYFLPGSGLPIIGPAELPNYRPDVVVIMNPVYRQEIERELSGMGLTPRIVTL